MRFILTMAAVLVPMSSFAQSIVPIEPVFFALPDLRCDGMWHPATAQDMFAVTVTNEGTAWSRATWLDVFANGIREEAPGVEVGDYSDTYVRIKPIPPGGMQHFWFNIPDDVLDDALTADSPRVWYGCIVDTTESVLEWHESNNVSHWSFQVYEDLLD